MRPVPSLAAAAAAVHILNRHLQRTSAIWLQSRHTTRQPLTRPHNNTLLRLPHQHAHSNQVVKPRGDSRGSHNSTNWIAGTKQAWCVWARLQTGAAVTASTHTALSSSCTQQHPHRQQTHCHGCPSAVCGAAALLPWLWLWPHLLPPRCTAGCTLTRRRQTSCLQQQQGQ